MKKLHARRGGFTLIELMIVVAIIGILAAIAIPNFLRFQLRAKAGEAKVNIAAIRTAEEGRFAEFGTYQSAESTPGGTPTPFKRTWVGGGISKFNTLGFSPEGMVYFNYGVDVGTGANVTAFSIGAQGDVDGDITTSDFGYIKPSNGGTSLAPTVSNCVSGGVWDGSAQAAKTTVGPCNSGDGLNEF